LAPDSRNYLQFNQIRDYLSKAEAEVFTKSIVPFLKADSYQQSGEIAEDTFTVMLHTCLINWLDNDTTTQEKVVESLEEAMEKCVALKFQIVASSHVLCSAFDFLSVKDS
jgi:sugar phosphate isomerase/epimerase